MFDFFFLEFELSVAVVENDAIGNAKIKRSASPYNDKPAKMLKNSNSIIFIYILTP